MFNSNSFYTVWILIPVLMGLILSGCKSTSELLKQSPEVETLDADYSIIYYIHADSDYLYHESDGTPIRGNSLVLKSAHKVAERAKSGEVFIYYQQPERKFLGLFPRRSSQLYHYLNGKLINLVEYRHSNKSENFLDTEVLLYHQYRIQSGNNDQDLHFLYFGHEIPLEDGKKYHHTLPDIEVNIETLSAGMQKFLSGAHQRFDLVVLSTCNNGSPAMAASLLPITNTMIASPQNLHLSHIDSGNLSLLEKKPKIPTLQLARSMAKETFNRLESEILTAITLSVYDFEIIREYDEELLGFIEFYNSLDTRQYYSDFIDCNHVENFDSERFRFGVNTWYKPARFGRESLKNSHSGWGCRPLIQN
tara:strand:+ start:28610 stop:29698 length:1089 start_codon:yes stop_codon:yes gene_type:complete